MVKSALVYGTTLLIVVLLVFYSPWTSAQSNTPADGSVSLVPTTRSGFQANQPNIINLDVTFNHANDIKGRPALSTLPDQTDTNFHSNRITINAAVFYKSSQASIGRYTPYTSTDCHNPSDCDIVEPTIYSLTNNFHTITTPGGTAPTLITEEKQFEVNSVTTGGQDVCNNAIQGGLTDATAIQSRVNEYVGAGFDKCFHVTFSYVANPTNQDDQVLTISEDTTNVGILGVRYFDTTTIDLKTIGFIRTGNENLFAANSGYKDANIRFERRDESFSSIKLDLLPRNENAYFKRAVGTDAVTSATTWKYKVFDTDACGATVPADATDYTEGNEIRLGIDNLNKYICFYSTSGANTYIASKQITQIVATPTFNAGELQATDSQTTRTFATDTNEIALQWDLNGDINGRPLGSGTTNSVVAEKVILYNTSGIASIKYRLPGETDATNDITLVTATNDGAQTDLTHNFTLPDGTSQNEKNITHGLVRTTADGGSACVDAVGDTQATWVGTGSTTTPEFNACVIIRNTRISLTGDSAYTIEDTSDTRVIPIGSLFFTRDTTGTPITSYKVNLVTKVDIGNVNTLDINGNRVHRKITAQQAPTPTTSPVVTLDGKNPPPSTADFAAIANLDQTVLAQYRILKATDDQADGTSTFKYTTSDNACTTVTSTEFDSLANATNYTEGEDLNATENNKYYCIYSKTTSTGTVSFAEHQLQNVLQFTLDFNNQNSIDDSDALFYYLNQIGTEGTTIKRVVFSDSDSAFLSASNRLNTLIGFNGIDTYLDFNGQNGLDDSDALFYYLNQIGTEGTTIKRVVFSDSDSAFLSASNKLNAFKSIANNPPPVVASP